MKTWKVPSVIALQCMTFFISLPWRWVSVGRSQLLCPRELRLLPPFAGALRTDGKTDTLVLLVYCYKIHLLVTKMSSPASRASLLFTAAENWEEKFKFIGRKALLTG